MSSWVAWCRLPRGRWYEVGHADSEAAAWRLALAHQPPQNVREKAVLAKGIHP